jgi:FkbM family methyltransferase
MSSIESKEVSALSQPVREDATDESKSTAELREFVSDSGHKIFGRPETTDAETFEFIVERNEYNLPARFNPDDIVIDIGAHIGSFSYAALVRGAGNIHAYEAHREKHFIAAKNLARFGSRVNCRHQAVWRSDQTLQRLFTDDLAGMKKTGGVSALFNDEGESVETISLDQILFAASDALRKPIRLLKIDCGGSEYPILFTSTHLHVVEEVCGEYHEVAPDTVPERAKVPGNYEPFDRFALKEFFEERGWSIVLKPQTDRVGFFHARANSKRRTEELDIAELMAQVRGAVRLREANGKASFIGASTELFKLISDDSLFLEPSLGSDLLEAFPSFESHAAHLNQSQDFSRLRLQPAFEPSADNRYHLNDLLKYHDRDFIWNAYRAILKREPDETGLKDFLERLRSGTRNKIDILASLRASAEGQRANVTIDGLAVPAFIRKVDRVPVVGYLAEMAVSIARLPMLVRSQRQIENHLVAQQERLAGHITQTNHQLLNNIESVRRDADFMRDGAAALRESLTDLRTSLTKLAERQKEFAVLQHQQQQSLRNNTQPSAGNINSERRHLTSSEGDEIAALLTEHLRGDREAVKKDLMVHLAVLQRLGISTEILDLGCGSGAWLELLKESGLNATGVDANPRQVEIGRRRGLEIEHGDVIEHLRALPEASLQAITGFHLLEHFNFAEQIQLLVEIRRVLKSGGVVILETPNPKNLVVGACNFYADPTHRNPIFPETLQFVLRRLNFVRTRIDYLHPVENSPFNNTEPGSQELHSWFFSPRDFAVTAWKA